MHIYREKGILTEVERAVGDEAGVKSDKFRVCLEGR